MPLKNYVNRVGPVVDADWLNVVDYLQQRPPTSTGTSTAYIVNFPDAAGAVPFLRRDGVIVKFRAHTPNGASPTVNVGGSGATTLTSNRNTILQGNEIATDEQVFIQYNSGTNTWNLVKPTTFLKLDAAGGGTLIDFTGATLRLGGSGSTWTGVECNDVFTCRGQDANGVGLSVSATLASSSFGLLRVSNPLVGSADNVFLSLTNTVDSDCRFIISEATALTKYVAIGPSVAAAFRILTSNAVRVEVGSTGQAFFPGSGTTASAANAFLNSGSSPANALLRNTSSLRYKTDVLNIDPLIADKFLLLRAVTYRSLSEFDDPNRRWLGFIAEEVHEIIPELVTYAFDEQQQPIPDGLDYQRMVVLLQALIKKHEQQILELQTQMAALQSQLSANRTEAG